MSLKKKILMIDDDTNLVYVIKTVFEVKGFDFFGAFSAAEGIEKIKQVEPDLIILDVIMEDFVAGFRVVSELRAGDKDSTLSAYSKVPILMLTSVTSKTSLNFSDRIGTALLPVDAFLEKPVKPAELLNLVDKMLKEVKL